MKESMQWSVTSISAQETQLEASSPMVRGGRALHLLVQVVLPTREGKSELLLPYMFIFFQTLSTKGLRVDSAR
jgi:hypothetical protein